MPEQPATLAASTALVTGGTSGLGAAMVAALAAAGVSVAFTGRSADNIARVESEVPGTVGFVADARDEDSVASAVEAVWDRLGSIDLLVNNAGIGMRTVNPDFLTTPKGFWEISPEGWRAVIETNLTGYFLAAREVTPRMLAAGSGRIVNISMNHATMNRKGFVPYGPSRAGAEALSRIMAADLAGTPVTVNLLLPGGATATGMIPDGTPEETKAALIDPGVMGPPIVWLGSAAAAGVHDERIVASRFDQWLDEWVLRANG
jgi:gluconate 5-dehydrogenase